MKSLREDFRIIEEFLRESRISKEMIRDEVGACEDWKKAEEMGLESGKQYYEQICK